MRVGIIGNGKVALNGHIPAFRQLGAKVVGIADSDEKALSTADAIEKYTDYLKLLKKDLDVVSICTPPFLHRQMCIDAAEHGINILVEKPLAMSVGEGADIKRSVEKSGVKLCVVHNYKFIEPIMKARRLHEGGQLGRILSIHTVVHSSSPPARETWRINERKAGSMILQWNHPLYLQTWFCGKPRSVYAVGKSIIQNYPSVRDVKALINFDDSTGYVEMSEFSSAPQFCLSVTGTGASVAVKLPVGFRMLASSTHLDALEEAFSNILGLGRLLRMQLTRQTRPFMSYTSGSHFRLISKFIESIRSGAEVPATVDEGILSVKLAKAIEESMSSKRKVDISD